MSRSMLNGGLTNKGWLTIWVIEREADQYSLHDGVAMPSQVVSPKLSRLKPFAMR